MSQKQLANKYCCDVNVVNGILSGKRWGHLWKEAPESLRQAIEDKKNARNTKGQSKLPDSTCLAIYNAYLNEGYSMAALSREHRRAERTICSLLKGETYKDVYSSLPEETKEAMRNRLANWRQRAGRPRKAQKRQTTRSLEQNRTEP